MDIRPVRTGDEGRLREVAAHSKAHWGYDVRRVREWAAGLDYTGKDVWVAEADGEVVAYAALTVGRACAELDELWVAPDWIGRGVGSALFRFIAAERGARLLEWEAEPNAVGFYERMGARQLRESGPSEWGRILPVMGIDL